MFSNQGNSTHLEAGITKIQLHKVTFTWTIEDFNFHEENGGVLKSPLFSAKTNGKYKWYMSLFPNGEHDDKTKIGFYLNLQRGNSIRKVLAKYTAHILDDQSRVLHSTNVKDNNKVDDFTPSEMCVKDPRWGWKGFLTKNDKFYNQYLSDNKLKIQCNLTFSEMNEYNSGGFEVPVCNLSESMAMLYEKHDFSDVIISVNGKNYPAHKSILCARSPVFAAMFKHNTKENQLNRIEIEDMKEEEVDEMLRYIYTGKCENLETLAEGLLAAADKYGLDRLKILCSEALFKTLTVENAANILIFAEMHSVDLLRSKTIEFIVRQFEQVMNTEGWKNVLANHQLVNEVFLAFNSALKIFYF